MNKKNRGTGWGPAKIANLLNPQKFKPAKIRARTVTLSSLATQYTTKQSTKVNIQTKYKEKRREKSQRIKETKAQDLCCQPVENVQRLHSSVQLGQLHQLLSFEVVVVPRRVNTTFDDGVDLYTRKERGRVMRGRERVMRGRERVMRGRERGCESEGEGNEREGERVMRGRERGCESEGEGNEREGERV